MVVRLKIAGGIIIVALFSLVFATIGLVSSHKYTATSNELYELESSYTSVSSVLSAHYEWRQGLTESVLSGTEFNGSLDSEACALGKWKAGEEAQNITDPEIISLLSQINEPHSNIHNEAKAITAMLQAGDSEGAKQELLENVLPQTDEVIASLTSMEARYNALSEAKNLEIASLGTQMTTTTVVVLILVVIAVVALCIVVTESVMRPLIKITAAAEAIATGDMDVQVSYRVNDQIGRLAKSFQNLSESTRKQVSLVEALADGDLTVEVTPRGEKDVMSFALIKMIDSLNDMFGEIHNSAVQVATGSKQIADGAQSLAQGSTEQASAVQQLSASVSEIAVKTKQNADIAREAADLSGAIKDNAVKGSVQMENMMQSVKDISDASGQIEKVIKVIDDIAFQTNILALNAAVEAARAGSAGKGFAVVAEEVRNLAAKSAEAAKDTGGLIENSVAKAGLGLNIATETSASLKEIVEGINRSAEIVAQIANSSDEQAGAIAQVNTGIDQVAQVIQQNSATAEESSAASQEMSGQSDMLEQLMSQFKLKNSDHESPLSLITSSHKKVLSMPRETGFAFAGSSGEYGKY